MEHFYKFMGFSVLLGACLDVNGGTASKATNCPAKHSQNISHPDQPVPGLDETNPNSLLIVSVWICFLESTYLALLISFKGGSLDETDVGMHLLRSESYTHTN